MDNEYIAKLEEAAYKVMDILEEISTVNDDYAVQELIDTAYDKLDQAVGYGKSVTY